MPALARGTEGGLLSAAPLIFKKIIANFFGFNAKKT